MRDFPESTLYTKSLVMVAPPQKKFAKLASALGLRSSDATVLSVIARHPDAAKTRVKELVARLDGNAARVADHLLRPQDGDPNDPAAQMAALLREWAEAMPGAPERAAS